MLHLCNQSKQSNNLVDLNNLNKSSFKNDATLPQKNIIFLQNVTIENGFINKSTKNNKKLKKSFSKDFQKKKFNTLL